MSRLALTERLNQPMRQPKELLGFTADGPTAHLDDRALRYYYFPRGEWQRGLNLGTGFENYKEKDESAIHLDSILTALIEHERKNGRVDAKIITWRGVLTRIISLCRRPEEGLSFNVTGFDGQVFIEYDEDYDKQKKAQEKPFPLGKKFGYTGYCFEKFATLPKPWGECTRDEIEGRYKGTVHHGPEYCTLVRSGVGSIKVVYAGEVDSVEGEKDAKDPLGRYVELKTASAINHIKQAERFEDKLFTSWLQSFLVGTHKVVYAFRDRDMKITAVEEYQTDKIPSLVKNSKINPVPRWNGNDAINFYAVFLSWIKDTVEDGKTYKLRHDPKSEFLELVPSNHTVLDRKVSFLLPEFVDWREGLTK